MLDNTGRIGLSLHRSNSIVSPTPVTALPIRSDLASRLAAAAGPFKNQADAKANLDQRSLIAVDNNYGAETLTNLFVTTSFEPKTPDQVSNVMRVVALLLVSKLQNIFTEDIALAVIDKLHTPSTLLLNQLEWEKDFCSASDVDQVKLMQQLHTLIATSNDKLQKLDTALLNLNKLMTNLSTLSPPPVLSPPKASLTT